VPWKRVAKNRAFTSLCIFATALSLAALAVLLIAMFVTGWAHLDFSFLTEYASRKPEKAGIKAALWGSIWICAVCGAVALPLGVGTAVYLEEFAAKNKLTAFIRLNITNLAGVPSIVYGILGLTAFVQMWFLLGNPNDPTISIGTREDWYYFQLPFGRGVLAGGLTLMLVVLPIVIVASQEALRAVPDSLREAALASGATRWQMVRRITLPAATPTIMTGSILAMSRAIGEAAPILVIAGIVFIRFTPLNIMDEFTAMPLQIYDWASRPQAEFHAVAAAGIIVLLAVLLTFNAVAVFIRYKLQKPLS
jgi:phosphate transport system permease protein